MANKTINCPKCDGKGYLAGIAYANGVCFCCNGQKTVTVNIANLQSKLSEDCRRKADWIMASTEASYTKLSYQKLKAIRDFAHGGWGLQEAYPEMLEHYRAVGEPAFQSSQNEKLASYYATC